MENGNRYGRGFTLWFTGLSGAGKTTIADIVERELRARLGKVEVLDGDIVRKNGSIVLLDRRSNEVARWNFTRAWPSKYTGPAFNAEASDVAIETLELVHEGVRRV